MKYKVKVTGILKKNGEMAHFGDIVEAGELISHNDSLEGEFVEPYEEKPEGTKKGKSAAEQKAEDKAAAEKLAAEQKAEEDRIAQEAAEKKAAEDQKILDDIAAEEAAEKLAAAGKNQSAADLLNAAKK